MLEAIQDHSPNIIVNDRPRPRRRLPSALWPAWALRPSTSSTSLDDIEKPNEIASVIIATMHDEQSDLDDYYGGPAFVILRESFQGRVPGGLCHRRARRARRSQLRGKRSTRLDPQGAPGARRASRALRHHRSSARPSAIVGSSRRCSRRLPFQPKVLKNVEHMADILFEADLVICSGGMTVYEIAALGRPGIVMCQNARELKRMEMFAQYGSIVHLGLGTEVGQETIAARRLSELLIRSRASSEP